MEKLKRNVLNEEDMYLNGVYKITNSINNKFYIGSAARVHKWKGYSGFHSRLAQHESRLRNNKHCNIYLQNSVNKYGLCNFKFEILEICGIEKCLEREQFYLNTLSPEYNLSDTATGVSKPCSEETKRKISIAKKGYKPSDEAIASMSKKLKGRKLSKEHVEKIRLRMLTNHPHAKLTKEQVIQIKILLKENNLKQKEIAKLFNVSSNNICSINKGNTWNHVKINNEI